MNEQILTKTCKYCNTTKSITEFSTGRHKCKLCRNKLDLEWRIRTGRNKNEDGSKRRHIFKYDLTGNIYGKLKVIKFTGVKETGRSCIDRASMFECECECGSIKEYIGFELKSGNVKSCGCLVHDKQKEKSPKWTGYKGLSGSSWNRIVRNCKNNRRFKRRNFKFTITKKYIWELFEKQNGKCAISGMDIILDVGSKRELQTASLDRIDSSKGYIEGNVQWVHKDINCMKMDFSEEYFLKLCNTIVNKNK